MKHLDKVDNCPGWCSWWWSQSWWLSQTIWTQWWYFHHKTNTYGLRTILMQYLLRGLLRSRYLKDVAANWGQFISISYPSTTVDLLTDPSSPLSDDCLFQPMIKIIPAQSWLKSKKRENNLKLDHQTININRLSISLSDIWTRIITFCWLNIVQSLEKCLKYDRYL